MDGRTTTYHYNNGMLLSEQTGDETLRYYYDSTGRIVSLSCQKGSAAEVSYFSSRNAQGDIIGVYRVSDSKLIGTYEYDLWGRPVSVKEATAGIDTDGILTKNPFRYRGYYYDKETGYYYLTNRYYNPEVRRFISSDKIDVVTASPMTLSNKNLYVYCDNNPVVRADDSGEFWHIVIGAAVGAAIGAVSSIAAQAISGQDINWTEVGISAASGAVSGAINAALPGMGIVATGLVQGAVGAATYAATEKIAYGRDPSMSGVITAGAVSGVLAGGAKAIGQYSSSRYLESIVKNPQKFRDNRLAR